MHELIVPLKWEYIEELLTFIDQHLTRHGFPTVLRVRAGMLAEELFSALVNADGDESGHIHCTFPEPKTISLQYHNEQGALTADFTMLYLLIGSPSSYGVRVQPSAESCTLTLSDTGGVEA